MTLLNLGGQQKFLYPFYRGKNLDQRGYRVGNQSNWILQSGEDHDSSEGYLRLHFIAEHDIGVEGDREDEWAGQPVDEDSQHVHKSLLLVVSDLSRPLFIHFVVEELLYRIDFDISDDV